MRKLFLVMLFIGVGSLSFAKNTKDSKKDRKPAQVATKKVICILNGTGALNGASMSLNSTQDTILTIGRSAADIKFTVIGNVNHLENNDKMAQNDCEPDRYDSTDVMKVSIPYRGSTSEGWLLCRTSGHGIYDGSKNCDKRPY